MATEFAVCSFHEEFYFDLSRVWSCLHYDRGVEVTGPEHESHLRVKVSVLILLVVIPQMLSQCLPVEISVLMQILILKYTGLNIKRMSFSSACSTSTLKPNTKETGASTHN